MYYEINVSKADPERDWKGNPSYRHLFATAPRSLTDENELKRCLKILVEKFPAPEYCISVHQDKEIRYGVDINEVLGIEKKNRLMEMFDIPKVKEQIKNCNPGEIVILCNNWSVNRPKYTDKECEELVDEEDWNALQDELEFVLEISDYDDLIVDPFCVMD